MNKFLLKTLGLSIISAAAAFALYFPVRGVFGQDSPESYIPLKGMIICLLVAVVIALLLTTRILIKRIDFVKAAKASGQQIKNAKPGFMAFLSILGKVTVGSLVFLLNCLLEFAEHSESNPELPEGTGYDPAHETMSNDGHYIDANGNLQYDCFQ